ncbi:MAG: hypothetical protein ACRDSJ_16865 [Rubrobacteraceae bacterium]
MEKVEKYKEFDRVPIPRSIPELGIEAGAKGTVHDVYDEGRSLFVEVSGEDGIPLGFVDLDLYPEPRVVAYSR